MKELMGVGFEQAVSIISPKLKDKLLFLPDKLKQDVFDIRLRSGKPVILTTGNDKFYFRTDSTYSKTKTGLEYICTQEIINDTFNRLCCYSVHSHLNELVRGYVTINGGHRVAVVGTAVMNSYGDITSLKNISSVSIRVAREKIGCSNILMDEILKNGQAESLIIAGPPCSGKTTLLRDIARNLSDRMYNVCVVDERQEIACMNSGFCGNELGDNTDILDCYPKKNAIDIAVRTLSPQIIVVDEVSTHDEIDAISSGVNSGVKFIVTVHASDFNEIVSRRQVAQLIKTYSFTKLVLLSKSNDYKIYDTGELYDEIIRRRVGMAELDVDWTVFGNTA